MAGSYEIVGSDGTIRTRGDDGQVRFARIFVWHYADSNRPSSLLNAMKFKQQGQQAQTGFLWWKRR